MDGGDRKEGKEHSLARLKIITAADLQKFVLILHVVYPILARLFCYSPFQVFLCHCSVSLLSSSIDIYGHNRGDVSLNAAWACSCAAQHE